MKYDPLRHVEHQQVTLTTGITEGHGHGHGHKGFSLAVMGSYSGIDCHCLEPAASVDTRRK